MADTKRFGRTQKRSQFRPPVQKLVNFDPRSKTKVYRSLTQKQSSSRPQHWNQVNSHPHSKIKSTSMPRHKNQVNFDRDTKTKLFSIPTHKLSQFPSLHWNQVNFDPLYWNQANFGHAQKTSQFRYPHQNRVWWYGLGRPVITSEIGNWSVFV